MRKLTFIDLFAGCGGLSEGFLKKKGRMMRYFLNKKD